MVCKGYKGIIFSCSFLRDDFPNFGQQSLLCGPCHVFVFDLSVAFFHPNGPRQVPAYTQIERSTPKLRVPPPFWEF